MSGQEKRFTYRVLAVFAFLVVIVSVSGCATLQQQIQQPTVRLENLAFLGGDLREQRYGITLEVDNPNGIPLPVRALNYSLSLAGRDFASGMTRDAFSIPARGREQIQLEVRTNLVDSFSHLRALLSGGARSFDYNMSGDIQIDLPLVEPIPFSRSGEIQLTNAQNTEAL